MILISALRDLGIKAFPILLSLRSEGRLPLLEAPTLDKLNTFIVEAETSDGTRTYMDGSAVYGGPNMLPTDLLVDRGRVFNDTSTVKWVDLTHIGKSMQMSFTTAKIDKDGTLTGNRKTILTSQKAYAYKSSFSKSKDSTEFVENIQNANKIKIESIEITGKEPMSGKVEEVMDFTKKVDKGGAFLYINPMIFTHISNNEFTQTERKLPIEFSFPYQYQTSCTITIPDGYKVEEMPKATKFILNDNDGECLYQVSQIDNTIQLNYVFKLNKTIFPQTDYAAIRDFFGHIASKNTEMVVLKKI